MKAPSRSNASPQIWRRVLRAASLSLIFVAALQPSLAEPCPPAVRAEIEALLGKLKSSACQFNRNGSWHSSEQAKAHLLRKLDYLEGKDLVKLTEQFIELGASVSSSTGKPYLVKCGSSAPLESRVWLVSELKAIRAQPQ